MIIQLCGGVELEKESESPPKPSQIFSGPDLPQFQLFISKMGKSSPGTGEDNTVPHHE